MANNVLIVGGERSGEYVNWFGHKVRIQREDYRLTKAYFTDGTSREYYVRVGMRLIGKLDEPTVLRIEVMG